PSWLKSQNPFLRNLVARAIQAAVVLAGLLIALDLLDATTLVGAVAGTAGLAGLALGFAFKDIVENYLAGLLLALQQPFDKNDHVVVDSHQGKVVRLTPRETILMTPDGNHIRLPNAVVFRSPMLNYTRNPRRRFQFDAGVGPSDDLSLARKAGLEVLREMEGVLDDPAPSALVMELGESWVTVRFLAWVDQREADFGRVRSEAIRLIKLRLEAAGISLPSPEYLVRLGDGLPADTQNLASVEGSAPDSSAARPQAFEATDVRGEQGDVSPDHSVDRQIDEDRRQSREGDLLEGPGQGGSPA
ncbi:MAG: mechanosensitive ion channel, partial [Gemmatimonadetes bacterium]|nr:mechanosensitive ion channel [Gemmatimonadota bacterium]